MITTANLSGKPGQGQGLNVSAGRGKQHHSSMEEMALVGAALHGGTESAHPQTRDRAR